MTSHSDYTTLLNRKLAIVGPTGIPHDVPLNYSMFPHQEALTKWAIKRGRAAIFADTGLGKTRMEIAWGDVISRHTKMPVLILAPLAVAAQTRREGIDIGIDITLCRDQSDISRGINITNYDRMHLFSQTAFSGVVLDESSIIKHHNARTFVSLTEMFRTTPYKLCATATPAPNDWVELGTHAEFLGICTRAEMLAEYFTHDGGDTSVWRLKRHARQPFWQWVSSWGAMISSPYDLGFDGALYQLPPLIVHEHTTKTEMPLDGMLFPMEAQTLSERRNARRISLLDRVTMCVDTVNNNASPWVVWCDLNDESKMLTNAIDGAIEITGADDVDVKESRLNAFASGDYRVLVSKPSICGWGLNWQHASNMAFVGVTDSYEAYYQAVRRCWRFGQQNAVHVHIFSSPAEGAVMANLKRKGENAKQMADSLRSETHDAVMMEVLGATRQTNSHHANHDVQVPSFLRSA
jgi:superfamily II DNA or RNA helicase